MTGGMRIEGYDWSGGSEAMLRFGPDDGPVVIAALPLFEEANRTRTAIVDVLRRLAAIGIGGALPDLPGTGESIVATADARLRHWRAAFAAAAATLGRPHVMAWRGGAIVDADADVAGRWYLSPVDGGRTVMELQRIRHAAASEDYAGNVIAGAMIDDLRDAAIGSSSTADVVRLSGDPRPARRRLPGPPLWRAAEPGTDRTLQHAVADDVAGWITRCAG